MFPTRCNKPVVAAEGIAERRLIGDGFGHRVDAAHADREILRPERGGIVARGLRAAGRLATQPPALTVADPFRRASPGDG
jgi:hypothetical protein